VLAKKNRLSRALFDTLLKSGVSFHSQNLSLRVMKPQKEPSRFSFVVSKKVSKSAVKRNQLRRRGYAVLGSILRKENKEKMNKTILGAFFFKKGGEKLSFEEIQNEIEFLLKKSGIL
jgi:ribonuclease P protein component